jgi:hypothetical protein
VCLINNQKVTSEASLLTSLLINRWSRFPDHEHWMLLITGSCHWKNDVMNTHTHSKNINTIKSSSFIAISNSCEVVLILRPWDHLNHWYRKGTLMIQTSHRNRVIIKVDLGTLKVLVEAHGSRVGFVHPDDGNIFSGLSRWYCIDIACKHVMRSQECLITERVKSTCQERDRTRYGWYQMIGSRTSNISWDKRN